MNRRIRLWRADGDDTSPDKRDLLEIFGFALALRLVVAILVINFLDRSITFDFDDGSYALLAQNLAEGRTEHWDPNTRAYFTATATLVLPLSFLYRLFGPHSIVGPLMVATFGAATAAAVAWIAGNFVPRRWAAGAGLVIAVMPSQVLYSSMTLKDPLVWFLLSAIAALVFVANRLSRRRLVGPAAGIVLSIVALRYLRTHTSAIAAFALPAAVWFGARQDRLVRSAAAALVAVLLPWALGLGLAAVELVPPVGFFAKWRAYQSTGGSALYETATTLPPQTTAPQRPVATTTTSSSVAAPASTAPTVPGRGDEEVVPGGDEEAVPGGDEEAVPGRSDERQPPPAAAAGDDAAPDDDSISVTTTSPSVPGVSDDVSSFPRGVIAVLAEPFPWSTGTARLAFAKVETLFWYPLLALALIGAAVSRARRQLSFFIVAAAGTVIIYALAEGNIGTAFRHRGELLPGTVVLAVVGAHLLASRRRERLSEYAEAPDSSQADVN